MSKFFLCEIENIEKSGIEIKVTGTKFEKDDDDCIRAVRTVCFDFSKHDKVFEDKISQLEKDIASYKQAFEDKCADYGFISELLVKYQQENESLKQRIAELESKETVDLPFAPLECANYLINATYERETNGIERTFHNLPDNVNSDRYTVDDLEQIAEHLLVYCKHNKESE